MYDYEECSRTDHISIDSFKNCPRCGSKNTVIQESLAVMDYCDKVHLIDAVECLDCDAVISIDLLMRLEEAEGK